MLSVDDGLVGHQPRHLRARTLTAKVVLDLAIAIPVGIFLAPLLLLIAVAIKASSPGPVFFRQQRVGFRGRIFRILKFRTLTVMEDGDDVRQVVPGDARVTWIGRWLRKTSLDELPQILNVLTLDMSIVGPRPHAVIHDEAFAAAVPDYPLRQLVRPGITGWAQVNDLRGPIPDIQHLYERTDYDIWYVEHLSLGLDVKILIRTIGVVLKAKNAW